MASASKFEIGPLPEVVSPQRRDASIASFQVFCESYFPDAFYLDWSSAHLRAIAKIERAVRRGGLFAFAMPRGSGKTMLCQAAVVWSALIGASPFVSLIASNAERAHSLLENIKVWLETNEPLGGDFPEVCYPIRQLERIAARQKTQRYQGEPTRILWNNRRIVLPTIAGSAASGAVIGSSGMRGSDIRGQSFARPDGKVIRPSLVLIDDPQTAESAWSASQTRRREEILSGDILGMAGPGIKMAGLMACTVIRPGDLADSMLDREKHPEWQGERTRLLEKFPENEALWNQYAVLRADSFRNDGDGAIATEFYREHREEMDAGAVPSWQARFNSDELSAIQHAMNLRFRDEAAFFAEYQNDPIVQPLGDASLTPEEIAGTLNGYERFSVPLHCSYITAFIDVHEKLLYYIVAAWESLFTGYVIDYGTYPEQESPYFKMRDAYRTLAQVRPAAGLEGRIRAGLEELSALLFERDLVREDGMKVSLDRCLIDANWGASTEVIYQFCRQSRYRAFLLPAHGKFYGASTVPMSDQKRARGDQVGRHWKIPNLPGRHEVRHIVIDTNFWKSFLHSRLAAAPGDSGSLSLFGSDPNRHKLLAEHLCAEYRVRTQGRGRVIDEWKAKPNQPDNHWLDCLTGAAAAASLLGAELPQLRGSEKGKDVISFARLQQERLAQQRKN